MSFLSCHPFRLSVKLCSSGSFNSRGVGCCFVCLIIILLRFFFLFVCGVLGFVCLLGGGGGGGEERDNNSRFVYDSTDMIQSDVIRSSPLTLLHPLPTVPFPGHECFPLPRRLLSSCSPVKK